MDSVPLGCKENYEMFKFSTCLLHPSWLIAQRNKADLDFVEYLELPLNIIGCWYVFIENLFGLVYLSNYKV